MTTQLTPNAITTISQQDTAAANNSSFQPVVQITQLKLVGKDRYRAVLSDGTHFVQGMLATQLNSLAVNGTLADYTVLRLDQFIKNTVHNKLLIIILQAQILHQEGQAIGRPTDIEKVRHGGNSNNSGGTTMNNNNKPAGHMPQQQQQQPLYNSTNNNPYGGGSASAGGSAAGMPTSSSSNQNAPSPRSRPNPYGSSYNNNNSSSSSAPIVRSNPVGGVGITPISNLNMYTSRWTIKARITEKSDVRTWSNAKGDGCLFSIELLDSSGTDIRGTFFKEAVDKFYNLIEVGKVYRISGGRLKVANMQYNNCKSSFEITFDQNTEIHEDADDSSISAQQYEFVKIDQLESVPANQSVDVLAIVKAVGDVAHIVSKKSGQEMAKCDLTLVDDSLAEITLTVWRAKAERAPTDFAHQPVVAFRRARVSDYGGKSLSAGSSVDINPGPHVVPQAAQLQQWWQTAGSTEQSVRSLSASYGGGGGTKPPLADRKTIASIKQESLGLNAEKGDYLSFKADLCFIKKDKEGGAWYPACPNAGEPCKNRYKVTQTVDQQWQCDKCGSTYPNCVRRWIFSGVLEDGSSSCWVSFFNEQAEQLLGGVTADDAYRVAYEQDETGGYNQDAYDGNFVPALYAEYVFKCKVRSELVNDETRLKTSVVSMWPVDFVQESKDLLAALDKF